MGVAAVDGGDDGAGAAPVPVPLVGEAGAGADGGCGAVREEALGAEPAGEAGTGAASAAALPARIDAGSDAIAAGAAMYGGDWVGTANTSVCAALGAGSAPANGATPRPCVWIIVKPATATTANNIP